MESPKRHCWECRRRCLVCDFAQPGCKRCSSSGTPCPGYSDAKPSRLRWLAPGSVTSRRHRGRRARSSDTEGSQPEKSNCPLAEVRQEVVGMTIPQVHLENDISALLDAVGYYNTCIYRDLVALHELGPNPTVYPLLPSHVQSSTLFPDHIRLSLICVTLTHRINRTRDGGQCRALTESYYRYRGLAMRSLRDDIDREGSRTSDVVLAGVMTLLLADIQYGFSSEWRYHLNGVQRLIALRGGLRVVAKTESLQAILLCFVSLAVFANTTCPVADLTMAQWHLEQLDFILEQYEGGIFELLMCPRSLFAAIIRINYLRMRAAQTNDLQHDKLSQDAFAILKDIDGFPAEEWAATKPCSRAAWLRIATVYKAAMTIYCISSLRDLSLLPVSAALEARCAAEGEVLHKLLDTLLSTPGVGMFMLWPLIMLGMEALNGPRDTRRFVERKLGEMSRQVGSHAPLTARQLLERYWASGERNWDACFDKPYAFATQIAVDLSQLSPP